MARYKVEILVVDTESVPGNTVASYPTFTCDTQDKAVENAAVAIREAFTAIDKQIATTKAKV